MVIERFAPSPTGLLHLGHAYSAHVAWSAARAAGGRFLLRMEDLDESRVRADYASAIEEDLAWLGLAWDGPVLFQSTRTSAYEAALDQLAEMGVTYRCRCTRRDIAEAIAAPQEGAVPHEAGVYPGTCRGIDVDPRETHAVRLDLAGALSMAENLSFEEIGAGPEGERGTVQIEPDRLLREAGDVVLRRRDGAVAYHLAVVLDDAAQEVTHVTRGRDLFAATFIHRVLQAVLGLPAPIYRHHALVRDDAGRRLAKRDDARAIRQYREDGLSPEEVISLAERSAR